MLAAVDEFGSPTDMTTVPAPRFDLLKVDRYASGALQYSRGCPFQCEFCDRLTLLWSLFWALLWDSSLYNTLKKTIARINHSKCQQYTTFLVKVSGNLVYLSPGYKLYYMRSV
ncbi:MAG TPA: hypothetical protein VMJ32_17930 [Pirellulales bacterium]|nr:hypothetical protein [Pirellulales bacterium]